MKSFDGARRGAPLATACQSLSWMWNNSYSEKIKIKQIKIRISFMFRPCPISWHKGRAKGTEPDRIGLGTICAV